MRRMLTLLMAASVSAPALAQHVGHPTPPPPPSPETGEEEAPETSPPVQNPHAGHNMPAAPAAPPATPPAANPAADPNRAAVPQPGPSTAPMLGHDMGNMPPSPPAAPAPTMPGHDMGNMPPTPPAAPAPTMPGHDMGNMPPGQAADPMAGHDMGTMGEPLADPPVAPPPEAALSGPAHAADTVFPADEMGEARSDFRKEHGSIRNYRVLVEQLEARVQSGRDGYAWDGQAWYGGAINRLWVKTEGEGTLGDSPEEAEIQALWSRALDPWFNVQAGIRYDFHPDPERGYLVVGLQGLAPYWFEVDGALFLSEKGDLSARFEGEYDQRITQRLILQPRLDLDFSLQDVPEIGVGSGLSSAEAGLRLRYEFVPEFAPYVGVHYGRVFGDTARFARAAGRDVGGWSLVLGVRTWF